MYGLESIKAINASHREAKASGTLREAVNRKVSIPGAKVTLRHGYRIVTLQGRQHAV